MSASDDMVAAVNAAEAAAQQLAQAYRDYTTGYRAAAQAVYASDPRTQAVSELEQSIGPHRLAQFAHARLVALGAELVVVAHQGGLTPAGPEWVSWLTGQIQAHVPEEAGVVRAG